MLWMPDTNDMQLLREYCAEQSEPAFETVVHRHVNLVYSTALRQIGSPAQAEEITQAVFIILARKAASLRSETVLPAWLHETTRYVTASYLRGEIRRRRREQEAYMQSMLHPTSDDSAWEQLAPLLDEAIGRLGTADRNVVVLRYFQNKSAQEIATALNVGEAAARKRLTRAVEKLRLYFLRRGIHVSTSTLSGAVSAHSVLTAPAGLAKTVAATALVKGSVASASTLTLAKGALKIMTWMKVKTAVVASVVVILTMGTATPILVHYYAVASKKKPALMQIHIKARFFEVPKTFFTEANFLPAALTNEGVLTMPDAKKVLHELESYKGTKELAEPEVVTISGRQTEMRVTREVTVVTNYSFIENQTGTKPGVMVISPQTTKVKIGPILDVVPHALSDGYTIALNTTASLIYFDGYAAPQGIAISYVTNSAGQKIALPISLPAFHISQSSTQKTLSDSQTLVLLPEPEPMYLNESDEKSRELVAEHIRQAETQYGNEVLLVLATATLIDAAGNRIHPGD
jgi:RNA polymerase sigma factor (sigma-70 family)